MKFIITGKTKGFNSKVIWENGKIQYNNNIIYAIASELFSSYALKLLWNESNIYNHKDNMVDSIIILLKAFDKVDKMIVNKEAKKYIDSYKIDEIRGKDMKKVEKTCKPRGGEKEQEFVSRCISEKIKDGKSKDEASGMCYGIWREAKKSEMFSNLKRVIKGLLNRLK